MGYYRNRPYRDKYSNSEGTFDEIYAIIGLTIGLGGLVLALLFLYEGIAAIIRAIF